MKKINLEPILKNQSNDAYVNPSCIVVPIPNEKKEKIWDDIMLDLDQSTNKNEKDSEIVILENIK